jgi:hypothetical protein
MIRVMSIRRIAPLGLCLAVATVPPAELAFAQDAPAQSMGDLRQEIDRLRQDVAQRDAELAAARDRIARLERELADLKAKSAPDGSGSAPPAAPAPVPADPAIGPGGLLAAMQAKYLADFPTTPDTSTAQKMNLHLRALEGWCARANRDSIRQLSWTGRIDPGSFSTNGRSCSFNAIFTSGTVEFRFPVSVEQATLSKARGADGTPTSGDVVFNAIVKPRLRVNPERPAPQAFEQPQMVAPYVDFVLELDVRSVLPAPGTK